MTLDNVEFDVREDMSDEDKEEILVNLQTLVSTPAGTVPLDRDFGIDPSVLGPTIDVAQSRFAIELINKVTKYEPRASALEVQLTPGEGGVISAKVAITSAK